MSNFLKSRKLYGDTVGFLSKTPVSILSITWIPNTAADALVLGYCIQGVTDIVLSERAVASAITSSGTITDPGGTLYPNTYAAGDVIDILECNTKANKGMHLITSAGNNSRIIVEAELTDVAADLLRFRTYKGRVFEKMFSAAKDTMQFHYDKDTIVPNLFISSIAGSGLVLVQIA